ncbi:MAG: MFS transporter [Spirochaetaceae bacterium]|nr:MAG: MFS transporter [Spirochaetaceae bacterium]
MSAVSGAPGRSFNRDVQYYKFCAYGFLKNLRFYEPFLMLFFLEKGLSYAQIGTLYATREVCINLVEVPSGMLADALGRRLTMIVSFLAYIVAFSVFFVAADYWLLFAAMVAYAFGDAFRTGTHKAMIFDYLNGKGWQHLRTHYYGRTRAWSQRGAAVSALIAAGLVLWHGSYAVVFLFTIGPYVLDLLLIASYPAALDGPRYQSTRSVRDEFAAVLRSLVVSMKHPAALRAITNQALYSGYYKACKDYLQPILKSVALTVPLFVGLAARERTAILAGAVYSLLYAVTAAASRRSGDLADRSGNLEKPLNLTLWTGAAFGLFSGVLYWIGAPPLAILPYIGIYILENLRKPMGITYVSERMQQQSLASALSVESQAETLIAAVMALLLGVLGSAFGLGPAIVLVSGLCLLVGILIRLPVSQAA